MAYRGTNLLLRAQQRAALDKAQRQQNFQNIQQAMAISEDIKNRQFERQRQQAEMHGRLAEQLMMQREPYAKAPHEEAAMIGQMEAKAKRQQMLQQQERERQQLEEKREYQEGRGDINFERAKKLRLISRPRGGGGGFGSMLKNSIAVAKNEVNHRKSRLDWMLKKDTYGQPNATPEQIQQAKDEYLGAEDKYRRLAAIADRGGRGRGDLGEYIQLQPGATSTPPPTQPTSPVKPTPGQMIQPSVTAQMPLERYTDPVAREFERRVREDPIVMGIEQRQKEQKLAQAREEMTRQQMEELGELEMNVKYMVIDKFSEDQIRDLASQYIQGDDKIKTQIERIIEKGLTHKTKKDPPITEEEWNNALDWMDDYLQRQQGGAAPMPKTVPKLMQTETTGDAFQK